ncbi:hypothetical protein ILUMI_12828 [Ignelater luminosus]|uniref:Uncharacterized protein n=1 Tax=Ignelater luminosus TaxID=2038154 RepID=A0A8K0CXE3_IGNLU|nr:hypothetical protein ILUMI_12828 [Ignelater luminosus]
MYVWLLFLLTSLSASLAADNQKASVDFLKKFHQNDYKLEFERVQIIHFKKQYMKKCEAVTFKYNRTTAVINMTWEFTADVGYNYNLVFQAYKFASNEYRQFPIRFQVNVCDAMKENFMGSQDFTRCGNFTGCPFLKNRTYRICNWSPDEAHFPPLIPNGRYMVEIQALVRTEEMFLARGYGTIYRPIVKK